MPVDSIDWDIPDDIHVLRGRATRRLDQLLVIRHSDGPTNNPVSPPPSIPAAFFASQTSVLTDDGITVTFTPPAFKPGVTLGFSMNNTTGVVTADPRPTGTHPRNFIVQAIVTKTGVPNAPPLVPPLPIRIHIHESIVDAFVTPRTLTLRKKDTPAVPSPAPTPTDPTLPDTSARFSVFAEFFVGGSNPDNKVFGDITRHPGLAWTSPSPQLTVNATTGEIVALADSGTADVQLQLPPDMGGFAKTGTIQFAESWGTPRTAKLISGSASAPAVPGGFNILLLPDGFVPPDGGADQQKFEDLALEFFTKWRSTPALAPFDQMPINLYTCWVKSPPNRGTTVGNLLRYKNRASGKRKAPPLETPQPPPAGNPRVITTIEQLLYQVGLPTPEEATASFQTKTDDWRDLYQASHFSSVSTTVYKQWRDRADYTLAFERDTAFGLRSGRIPQVAVFDDGRSLGVHPGRTKRSDIDKLLTFLSDSAGRPIGSNWLTGLGRAGVAILAAGGRYGGARSLPPNELISISCVGNDDATPLMDVASRTIPQIRPFDPPPTLPLQTYARLTHETGHALGCGDEYGGLAAIQASRREQSRRTFANLHDEADLKDPSGQLMGTFTQWFFWPRIASAGLVIKPITGVSGNFLITIRLDPRSVFKGDASKGIDGDKVRLRHRPFMGVEGTGPDRHLRYLDESITFEITRVTNLADGIEITVKKDNAADPFTPTDWISGQTILFKPLDTFMMHEKVAFAINASHTALSRKPPAACDTNDRKSNDADPQQRKQKVPGLKTGIPKDASALVGLYDGGTELDCGIFHPTGSCMMRAFTPDTKAGKNIFNSFCPICRYIIVDFIDPAMHGRMNDAYALIYPKATP
jgi:hypothetical protein